MTCAVLSTRLRLALSVEESAGLLAEFCLWKDGGIGAGDYFGKDSAFMRPKSVVDAGIRKVHLETPDVTAQWDRKLKAGVTDADKYTSDKVLVYVRLGDVKHAPYMLLVILEPGHQQMSDPDLVLGLAILYEQERNASPRRFLMATGPLTVFPCTSETRPRSGYDPRSASSRARPASVIACSPLSLSR